MNTRERHVITLGSFSKVLNSFFVYTGDEDDVWVQKHCKELGIWDPQLTEWIINNVKPGWKCLDIGSNNGYFTELLARVVGKDGKVQGFEPLTHLVENYKISTQINNYDHCGEIIMHPYALSDQNKKSKIYVDIKNIGASRLDLELVEFNNILEQDIETIRLDSIYTETPDFIKIDIEGHEVEAILGMHENTKKCPLIVAEIGLCDFNKFKSFFNNYDINYLDGRPVNENNISSYTDNIVLRKR